MSFHLLFLYRLFRLGESATALKVFGVKTKTSLPPRYGISAYKFSEFARKFQTYAGNATKGDEQKQALRGEK
jgi:hypothetical protein